MSHLDSTPAETSGFTSSGFGFEMNAKMYSIFLDKMYKDKAGAVIRELSANAWDSHVDAGNTLTPFEIQLPTWLDKTFSIRDYGTGIPHDSFEHVYTNIGNSTKEHSNDFIGSYGLGSKSPFSLTDTFIVDNIHDGIKSVWVCFKSAGFPQVTKVSSEPTDEHTGVKVSFSLEKCMERDFRQSVVRQLRFYTLKPIVTGADLPIVFPEMPNLENGYAYDGEIRENLLVMGNVNYPIDLDSLGAYDKGGKYLDALGAYDKGGKYLDIFRTNIILKAELGDVDIPPSRESLEYTEKTKEWVYAKIDRIIEEHKANFILSLSECTTVVEASILTSKSNSRLLDFTQDRVFEIGGFPIKWTALVAGRVSFLPLHSKKYFTPSRANKFPEHNQEFIQVEHLQQTLILINDYTNNQVPFFKEHIEDTILPYFRNSIPYSKMIILKAQTTYDKLTLEEDTVLLKDRLLKEYNVKAVTFTEVLGIPPIKLKTTKQYSNSEPNQVFTINNYDAFETRQKEQFTEYKEKDLPTEGYYIELSNWSSLPNQLSIAWIANLVSLTNTTIYAVRSKTVKKLPSTLKPLVKGLTTFNKAIKKHLQNSRDYDAMGTQVVRRIPLYAFTLLAEGDKHTKPLLSYIKKYSEMYVLTSCNNNILRAILRKQEPTWEEAPLVIPTKVVASLSHYNINYRKLIDTLTYNVVTLRDINSNIATIRKLSNFIK